MRRARLLAASALLLAFAAVRAQDNFPDVPANHWAYEALARMKKDGLLVGYPDGLYRGGRPASRYELAVAMHAVYTNLKNITDGLDAQVRAVGEAKPDSRADVVALRDAITALQRDLAAMKGYGADIADLRRAADTFEKELTQLGVDVQAMKDDLRSLAGRVSALEAKRPKIEISGDLNFWLGGGHTLDGRYGLTRDGRLTGIRDKGAAANVFPRVPNRAGITDDLAILHEAAVTLKSTNETGVKLKGTLVATNAFGQAPVSGVPTTNIGFGNQSDLFSPVNGNAGSPALFGYADGSGDLYLQELAATYSFRGLDLEAGRVRHKATPWILQRIDNTLYFDNERWDDGRYTLDGAIVSTKLGPVRAEVYGGKNSSVLSKNGVIINPLRSGAANGVFGPDANRLEAERTLGATLTTKFGSLGLRGDYLILDTTTDVTGAYGAFNHLDVYGGEATFGLGRFNVGGGLRQSKAYNDVARVAGLTDTAWDAKVAWGSGPVDLSVQYREVGLNYLAPGDWGRLGILRNPTNIRGFVGSAGIEFGPRYSLTLGGELSKGLDDSGRDVAGTFFDRGTDIGRFNVRFDAKLSSNFGAFVSYEQTTIGDLAGSGLTDDPRYRWYGIGLVHGLSGNAKFSLAYEQSAVSNDYQTSGGTSGNSFRGGFLTSQITVKF